MNPLSLVEIILHVVRQMTGESHLSLCFLKERIQVVIKMILKLKLMELVPFHGKYQIVAYSEPKIVLPKGVLAGRDQCVEVLSGGSLFLFPF